MMLAPVVYSDTDLEFVRRFENGQNMLSNFWSDAVCDPIRSRIKKHYLLAQRNTCCYCRQVIPEDHARAWDAEHVVPRSTHPQFMFTPQNLALACLSCNVSKSNKQTLNDIGVIDYPFAGDDFLVVHPHFDAYNEHIESSDFIYVARTPKGEWTITACNLTRFAGRVFGWPDPIADDRYEEDVDAVFEGSVAPSEVAVAVRLSIEAGSSASGVSTNTP
jgi:hypothetical protein